jgi:hypothetical protein
MTTLYEMADVIRSKNAGPLLTTIDLLFDEPRTFDRVVAGEVLTPGLVAELYAVSPEEVKVVIFDAARAIKITFPRAGPTSGAPGDRDVYGAQQHGPIGRVEVP